MSFYPGQRLSFDSQACTVRYIGAVAGTKGEWLGVEWDDTSRGKHNGEHQGHTYFRCLSRSSTAASFVRPTRPSDRSSGVSFLQALRDKYVEVEPGPGDANPVYFNGKLAEEIGFDKIRQQLAALKELKVVILDGACLSGLFSQPLVSAKLSRTHVKDAMHDVQITCPSIRQLDLSNNLLDNWVDVAAICHSLPALTSLDLSRNRFSTFVADCWTDGDSSVAFGKVNELSLDSTLLSCDEIVPVLKSFSNLQSLSLVSNQLDLLPKGLPETLMSLDLAGNDFACMKKLAPLSSSRCLERLSLRSCPIATINLDNLSVFPTIKFLDIYQTKLQITDIGFLPIHFPALQSLHCSVTGDSEPLLVVASIGSLKILNYSTITAVARRDAELYYLSHIGKKMSAVAETEEAHIVTQHPRYSELCNVHGEPIIKRASSIPDPEANTLRARFITFSCFDHREKTRGTKTADDSKPDFEIRLPMSWDLYKVYASVAGKLGVLPLTLSIIWETEEWDPVSKEKRWPIAEEDESVEKSPFADYRIWDLSSDDEPEAVDTVEPDTNQKWSRWHKREVVLEPGPREVGFWIETKKARLRVEQRTSKSWSDH